MYSLTVAHTKHEHNCLVPDSFFSGVVEHIFRIKFRTAYLTGVLDWKNMTSAI